MQYRELTPRTLGRMKTKLTFDVVNASVPEPITSLNGDGNLLYFFFFFPLLVRNVERCAENEKVILDAVATAICIFIRAFTFRFYIISIIQT